MDSESWLRIQDFPDYAVSNHGRVMNVRTELIKRPTCNQQGIPNVLLMQDRVQHRRSVPLLVASHFIPNKRPQFDTPINLDGDRMNNHWENLEWRPRWFAIKYHAQFKRPIPYNFRGAVYCVETGLKFEDVRLCAMTYGLLEKEIIMSTHTQAPVFPTWQTFGMLMNTD